MESVFRLPIQLDKTAKPCMRPRLRVFYRQNNNTKHTDCFGPPPPPTPNQRGPKAGRITAPDKRLTVPQVCACAPLAPLKLTLAYSAPHFETCYLLNQDENKITKIKELI